MDISNKVPSSPSLLCYQLQNWNKTDQLKWFHYYVLVILLL